MDGLNKDIFTFRFLVNLFFHDVGCSGNDSSHSVLCSSYSLADLGPEKIRGFGLGEHITNSGYH